MSKTKTVKLSDKDTLTQTEVKLYELLARSLTDATAFYEGSGYPVVDRLKGRSLILEALVNIQKLKEGKTL